MVTLDYRVKVSQVKRTPRPPKISERLRGAINMIKAPEFIPILDEPELKFMLSQFYHSDPRFLSQLDRIDLAGMGYEKSTSIRTKPNPTTGQNLSDCLGWSDVEFILNQLEPAQIYALGVWVGRPIWDLTDRSRDLSRLTEDEQMLRDEQSAQMPLITKDLQADALKALSKLIHPYLKIKRDPR